MSYPIVMTCCGLLLSLASKFTAKLMSGLVVLARYHKNRISDQYVIVYGYVVSPSLHGAYIIFVDEKLIVFA